MYKILAPAMTAELNFKLEMVPTACTFSNHFDTVEERLENCREANLFMSVAPRRADMELAGMPVLLFPTDSDENTVVVRTPTGLWIDVTRATAAEINDMRLGSVSVPAPQGGSFVRTLFDILTATSNTARHL